MSASPTAETKLNVWPPAARWVAGVAAALIATIVTYGMAQFGRWADTLSEVNRTVDQRADKLQAQMSKIALEQAAQIHQINVTLTRIDGKLGLIDQRDMEMERRQMQHEGRPWHDSAGEAIGNQGTALTRIQDRVQALEDETEKRLDVHTERMTNIEQQRNRDHNPYRGQQRGLP